MIVYWFKYVTTMSYILHNLYIVKLIMNMKNALIPNISEQKNPGGNIRRLNIRDSLDP